MFENEVDFNQIRFFAGLQSKYSGSASNLCDSTKFSVYINGPAGIHVFVTDEVLGNIKDESLFTLEVQNNKVLMKIVYKNEIWVAARSQAIFTFGIFKAKN